MDTWKRNRKGGGEGSDCENLKVVEVFHSNRDGGGRKERNSLQRIVIEKFHGSEESRAVTSGEGKGGAKPRGKNDFMLVFARGISRGKKDFYLAGGGK